jgi:hypothetical protein
VVTSPQPIKDLRALQDHPVRKVHQDLLAHKESKEILGKTVIPDHRVNLDLQDQHRTFLVHQVVAVHKGKRALKVFRQMFLAHKEFKVLKDLVEYKERKVDREIQDPHVHQVVDKRELLLSR